MMFVINAKKSINILFCLFVLLVISPAVASIGIGSSPLPKLHFFEPNMELVIDMKCFEYTDDCEPYATGEFSEYLTFSDLTETGPNEKSFRVTVKMPAEIGTPGKHTLYIGVTDIEKSASTGISVITKVRKAVNFMVLYETKYAAAAFSAPNINEDETAIFRFEVSNFGKQDLMLVYGKVDIFNIKGEKVGSVKSKSTSIKSTETKTISAEWDSHGTIAGEYTAVGTLVYDSIEKIMNSTFLIGTKEVEILNYTKNFEIGKISRMDIDIINRWNGPINDLYAVVNVGQIEFKTPSISLNAFQSSTLTGHIDTTNLESGEHEIEMTLRFDGNEKKEKGIINVFKSKEKGLYLPMKLGLNLTTALICLVVLLVLFNIIIVLRMRKKT